MAEPDWFGSDRRADGQRSNSTHHDSHSWCICGTTFDEKWPFAGIYGEGRSRTADTTIFSQGTGSHDLALVAGTFLIGHIGDLPLVSSGFGWIWVVSDQS
jgi:hypothetical protein